jgi:hypothetical protein
MSDISPRGFVRLRQNIINCASAYLEKLAPKHVKAFRETFAQGKDPEYGLSTLVGIRVDRRFKVWRNICINLIDVELQMHRVKNCLILVISPAVSPLNQGEWIEYNFNAWTRIPKKMSSIRVEVV